MKLTRIFLLALKILPAYALVVGAWIGVCVFITWLWVRHADALIIGACVLFLAVAWGVATEQEKVE